MTPLVEFILTPPSPKSPSSPHQSEPIPFRPFFAFSEEGGTKLPGIEPTVGAFSGEGAFEGEPVKEFSEISWLACGLSGETRFSGVSWELSGLGEVSRGEEGSFEFG